MDNLTLTYADVAILAVLALSALLALIRGFVREVLHILAWLGAAAIAIIGFPYLQPVVAQYLRPDLLANLATGAGLFVVSLIVLILIAATIARKVRQSDIGLVDRVLGALFGVARGMVLLALAYMVLMRFLPTEPKERPEWLTASLGLPYVAVSADYLTAVAPEAFAAALRSIEDAGDAAGEMLEGERLPAKADAEPAADGAEPGYGAAPRQQMDRLIESQQGAQ